MNLFRAKTSSPRRPSGFTLVITIALMVLLALLAVGMLSLASISVRVSAHGDAMATARGNARLALALALGELQKSMGPDRAISAGSEILEASPGKPNLTGVWESWDYDPLAQPPDYAGEKQNRFRRWLVSTRAPADAESTGFVSSPWPEDENTALLVGPDSLGGDTDAGAWAQAEKIPVRGTGNSQGAYAWHVSDESLKARINLYREPQDADAPLWKKRALLTGHRPDPSVVRGANSSALDFLPTDLDLASYTEAERSVGKMIHLSQANLFDDAKSIGAFRNHVTPYSLGLLTNVRQGGFKHDLSSVFEFAGLAGSTILPDEFRDLGLYETTHGISGESDPRWSALSTYYNSFRQITNADTDPTYRLGAPPPVSLSEPAPPGVFFPGPTITGVDVLFTYVTRDSHGPWSEGNTGFKYMGHLIYTPLVTLHNPYNVSISFEKMRVTIRNVPIAFNFYVNNVPQSSGLMPLTEMFVNSGNRREIQFVMEIADWAGRNSSSTNGPLVLKPGQTLICSPYLDPSETFGTGNASFFDYRNNLTGNETSPIKARPGFFGPSVGFDIDWLTPTHQPWNSNRQNDGNRGVLLYHDRDQIHFDYGIRRPTAGLDTSFRVTAKMTGSRGRVLDYGELDFHYEDDRTLRKHFPVDHRYPVRRSISQRTSYAPNNEPISDHSRAQTFAVFSAQARTTNGGVYETGRRTATNGALNALHDGRLAGKPFLFHNPSKSVTNIDLRDGASGAHSHEINFQALPGHVDDILEIDRSNRTNSLTGNTTIRGIKSGSYLEIPTGPMRTLADFRRSNALTSFFLPNFVQPVANSSVSPLMSTGQVVQDDSELASYQLLDHSVLANHALYDRYYFSTFATQPDASGRPATEGGVTMTPDNVFERFLNSETRLPSQAFQPHVPPGESPESAKGKLYVGGKPSANAYREAAGYQLLQGPFNVNSTSVEAWKATLSALRGTEVPTLWAKDASLESISADGSPVVPMSLVNGGLADDPEVEPNKIDNGRTNEWNGFRSLSDAQLTRLAEEIVAEVRGRGPFLSLSEFVNRRIGAESAETLRGALEAAIEKSGLNDGLFDSQVPVTEDDLSDPFLYKYKTPAAAAGNPAAGAPGWISQGDLMGILGPAATVRSDTFVIRTTGEARDKDGSVTARAYAEAVVQRLPEFVDPADAPSVNVADSSGASEVNRTFGRRFRIVSFRWLSQDEI